MELKKFLTLCWFVVCKLAARFSSFSSGLLPRSKNSGLRLHFVEPLSGHRRDHGRRRVLALRRPVRNGRPVQVGGQRGRGAERPAGP